MDINYFSYWEKDTWFTDIDLAIVGSGIVGLSSAWFIKRKHPEWKVLVLESGVLPHGATTRNAGFACFGSLSEIVADLILYGEEKMIELVRWRWEGLQALLSLHNKREIDYWNMGGYELFTGEDDELWESSRGEMRNINRLLRTELGFDQDVFQEAGQDKIARMGLKGVKQMLYNPFEGQLHSGRLMQSLITKCMQEGVLLLNNTRLNSFENTDAGVQLDTTNGTVSAERLLVCNNGFARQLIPDLEVLPARGQILVTAPIEDLPLRGAFHHQQGYNYFRNVGDRVLLGGGRHRDLPGEETVEMLVTESIQEYLEKLLREVIIPGREYTIEHRWSGIMGLGPEKSPIIRQLSERVWCAVRMGGMGVAIGTNMGKKAAEMFF